MADFAHSIMGGSGNSKLPRRIQEFGNMKSLSECWCIFPFPAGSRLLYDRIFSTIESIQYCGCAQKARSKILAETLPANTSARKGD
jgi:hypothetical protein